MHLTPSSKVSLVIVALLSLPAIAAAQSNEDQATAQVLFDEGMELFAAKQFDEACSKFAGAVELYPEGLGARGKLASCYEKVGKTASAWAAWREISVRAGKSGERRRQRVADRQIAKLEPLLARLTINVSNPVPELEVTRNGASVVSGAYGSAIAVDPGTITIKAEAPGYEPWTSDITIAAKASHTVDVPALDKTPEPPKEEPAAAPIAAPVVVAAPTETGRNKTLLYSGIGAGAVGLGLVIAGSIFGLDAKAAWNEAYDDGHCVDNQCTQTGQDLTDAARSDATVSTVLFSVGAAAAIAGGGLIWWSGRAATSSNEPAVSLAPSHDGLSVAVSGRF